ncbi:MAG: hypothetical protein KBT04_04200, partial [Bacteroidales bacterium]|nr:hypothetical protein [Candidatus Colimorpha onthohippi]
MEIKTAYTRLRREVEKTVGRTMESPSDFSILSRDIRKRTHDTVSATTLKRFYGYVRGGGVPRTSTLSILSRYVGYEGWNSFLNSDGVESCFLSDYVIRSEGMLEGDMVRFGWNPDRMCVV